MPTTILPCAEAITCPGSDSPILNISAEAPDLLQFWAVVYAHKPNPIGLGYGTFDGVAVGVSDQSQQDANTNATTVVNNNVNNPAPADPSPITPPPADPNNIPPIPQGHPDPTNPITNQQVPLQRPPLLPPPPISPPTANTPPFSQTHPNSRYTFYPSDPQTCAVPCPTDGSYFYTLPAKAIYSAVSVDEANKSAAKYACAVAASYPMCLGDIPAKLCCDQPTYFAIPVHGPRPATGFVVAAPGILPMGLTLNAGTGIISGVPTTQGVFGFSIKAFDSLGNYSERTYVLTTVKITNAQVLPAATVGSSYLCVLNELGATLPTEWTVTSGSLPPGLSLDIYTGQITGTPPLTIDGLPNPGGDYTFEVTMQDATNPPLACRKTFILGVAPNATTCVIDNVSPLDPGSVCNAYAVQFTSSTTLTYPVNWTISGGALPGGWNLSAGGLLNGTAAAPGDYGFDVTLTDSSIPPIHCTKHFTVHIEPNTPVDWSQLVWDAPVLEVGNPAGTVSATVAGANFSLHCDYPAGNAIVSASILCTAHMPYTGPVRHCIVSFHCDAHLPDAVGVIQVVAIDSTDILSLDDAFLILPSGDGAYGFVVPAAVGATIHVTIYIQTGSSNDPSYWDVTAGHFYDDTPC